MTRKIVLATGFCLAAGGAFAQSTPAANASANPYTSAVQQQAKTIQGLVLRTAEKVPEELYSFKPTEAVRSLGGLLGHIADANFLICRFANDEKPKMDMSREKLATKAEIISALKESFAFCDGVAAKITDANGSAPVTLFGQPNTKFGVLDFSNNHVWEHYGNLVTYMRLKNIVPPSSERSQD
jgi:uncharacterized damage-inducible protein DinB